MRRAGPRGGLLRRDRDQRLRPGIYYDNLVMGANLMEAARLAGVGKFVAIGTACSYPGYLEGHPEGRRPLGRPAATPAWSTTA